MPRTPEPAPTIEVVQNPDPQAARTAYIRTLTLLVDFILEDRAGVTGQKLDDRVVA